MSSLSELQLLYRRDEDACELITFLAQRIEPQRLHELSSRDEFQPVIRFIEFLERWYGGLAAG